MYSVEFVVVICFNFLWFLFVGIEISSDLQTCNLKMKFKIHFVTNWIVVLLLLYCFYSNAQNLTNFRN